MQSLILIGAMNYHPLATKMDQEATSFDYEIVYQPGKENSATDALSRRELGSHFVYDSHIALIAGIWGRNYCSN